MEMDIERIVNLAGELNETHHCGRDAAFMTAALMGVAEKLETFLQGPCCRANTGLFSQTDTEKETPETEICGTCGAKSWENHFKNCQFYATPSETEPETKTVTETPETKTGPLITLDELRELVLEVVQRDKREAVAAILKIYKAKLLTDIPEKDYPDFKARLESL